MDCRQAYLSLHDTPMQEKIRRIRPWPVGAVFVEWPGMTDEDIRTVFRKMKRAGFTCLKQVGSVREQDRKRIMHMALDEGLIPWWYAEAGFEDPTPELAQKIGLPENASPDEIMNSDVYKTRQLKRMRARIEREGEAPHMTATADIDDLPGTIKKHEYGLPSEMSNRFTAWLKDKYETVERLKSAWNFDHYGIRRFDVETWEEVDEIIIPFINAERGEYNRMMDVLRFKSQLFLKKLSKDVERNMLADPNRPLRAGGEMGLFLPTPLLSADMEGIADIMADAGSYYPSMHLAWHFEETDMEFVRPVYMQAALAADYMKNGWAATWESTGGPQRFTGGKGSWWAGAPDETPSFTVDGGVMRQLMLSWVAAGFKGFGLWTWNARTAGWEGGEYGLTDKDGEETDRVYAAGEIGKACLRYKNELWQADKAPVVGVYVDWESEALWTAMSLGGREHFRSQGILARIGLCRALINAGIPFEFVTPKQLRAGIAGRYQMIYLTAAILLQSNMLALLTDYAEAGGRVVLDAPGGIFDEYARVISSAVGSSFERLFGARLANLQSSNNRRPWKVDGYALNGAVMDIVPTDALVQKRFDDGRPAVTLHALGAGEAVLCGWSGGLCCLPDDSRNAQRLLLQYILRGLDAGFHATGALAYRLVTPNADRYFLINDGESCHVGLTPQTRGNATDAITGETIADITDIVVAAHDARWIRVEKAR